MKRKIHAIAASTIAVGQLFVFAMSSMAGPHQLEYLAINLTCSVIMVLLAAF